ncbi:hypothetical protein ACOSQ3_027375 [Xanthoceras sorbifolium]
MSYQGESSRAVSQRSHKRLFRVNLDFKEHKRMFHKRVLYLERGIDVASMEGTVIPAMIADRQWERYVQHPNDASKKLVKEFYASMIPEDFFAYGTVLVQGHPMTLTPEIVNNFFPLAEFS